MSCAVQAALRTPFRSRLAGAIPPAAAQQAARPAYRELSSAASLRGGTTVASPGASVLAACGGRLRGPMQPQARRWHGVVAAARGGKQKKKQDDSECLI